jgi:two-component system, OmpR family, sensor histidine kinase KdpD
MSSEHHPNGEPEDPGDALDARVDPDRPTGDQMMARLRSEGQPGRGRLRVYLGMAPGVGKTYRMLEEAHRRLERGTDVIVGFVETYDRRHTAALLDGLEIVPRARVEYRGVTVEEMDTDAVIARRPVVALVDELAHTNVPGSLRQRRWEDVELIRDAGIHVISTCNVQHVDSIADAVTTILGVPVRERIPDEVIWGADEIELVDMSPHALRQRMRHGNVYPPDRAAIALEKFFTEPNLMALRDLTLRFVAGRVDDELEGAVAEQGVGIPPITERVMAVIDETKSCHRVLRRAASLASVFRSPFLAVAVETPRVGQSRDRLIDLQENMDYAVDLGAEVFRVEASDLVSGLVEITRARRVSHLILAHRGRRGMDRLLRPSIADELVERVPGLEVHLVGEIVGPASDRSHGA